MTFICPYCHSETSCTICRYDGFGISKCKVCGKKFRYMPIAIPYESEPSYNRCRDEASMDNLKYLGIAIVVIGVSVDLVALIVSII